MVLALAGDSTITSDLPILTQLSFIIWRDLNRMTF
ncbi:Uncharacterised protein [Vibrio cholerae]|nr:Uncharacterised protein [Vibrio cholerae]CSC08896.1 Uncharacterised protein [Vibrio cholerae]CSC99412.1 Uncharacterised protein [Vibrio cholerae]